MVVRSHVNTSRTWRNGEQLKFRMMSTFRSNRHASSFKTSQVFQRSLTSHHFVKRCKISVETHRSSTQKYQSTSSLTTRFKSMPTVLLEHLQKTWILNSSVTKSVTNCFAGQRQHLITTVPYHQQQESFTKSTSSTWHLSSLKRKQQTVQLMSIRTHSSEQTHTRR